jgi:uncharacterized protein
VTDPEPITRLTPRPLSRAPISQTWRHVALLHWEVDPEAIAPLLPAGVEPDVLGGRSYAGLIGFRMVGAGAAGLALPYFGSFWELNVRLYSVDARGRRGVVFLSLESSRLAAALGARAVFGLPYTWARMSAVRDGDVVRWRSERRALGPRPADADLRVAIGERIDRPSELEDWLTARWGLHTRLGGRTVYLPNEHPAWRLHRAETLEARESLLAAASVHVDGAPVSTLYSPGVPVRFGRPLEV